MPIRRFSYYISETFANLQTGVSRRLKPSRCLFRRTHKGFLDRYHSLLLCEVWSTRQNIRPLGFAKPLLQAAGAN
jgi:hypothetical protein